MRRRVYKASLPPLVVVSGAMRTGTTLMGELLYSRFHREVRHPHICFANDSINDVRELSGLLRDGAEPAILRTDPFTPLPFEPQTIGRFYDADGTGPADFALELIMRIRQAMPMPGRPRYYGFKQTHLLQEIDLLRRIFPRVKLILMMRDPRAVFSSYRQREWVISGSAVNSARPYQAYLVLLALINSHTYFKQKPRSRDLVAFRYEDLVADPRQSIGRMLRFLKLDPSLYNWAGLESGRVPSNSSYDGDASRSPRLGTGIFSSSIDAYRSHMSEFDCYCVERLTKQVMADFGYAATSGESAVFSEKFEAEVLPALAELATESGYFIGDALRC